MSAPQISEPLAANVPMPATLPLVGLGLMALVKKYLAKSTYRSTEPENRLSRIDDGNALKLAKHEQVLVARNDEICPRGNSQCKQTIVIGIAADRLFQRWRIDDEIDQLANLGHGFFVRTVRANERGNEL